ncbi:hypothetical protein [Myceligenerans crystallogenes]|uniref:hypothetical protein n=1 Tax=Myceligenerans crystallogenes TaxID=316335 RepID=UPI0031DA4A37
MVSTVVGIALGLVGSFFGFFWGMFQMVASTAWSDAAEWVSLPMVAVMILGPWASWLVSTVWAIIRLVRRQPAARLLGKFVLAAVVTYVLANVVHFVNLSITS